jgi:hypothetical protein
VRTEVQRAVGMKRIAFWWIVTMGVVITSEISVSFYKTAQCNIPEGCQLQMNPFFILTETFFVCRRENLVLLV